MDNKVKYNDTDFDSNIYDFYTFLMYKGKPFTGTLLDGNDTTEFRDGNAHGKSISYHNNGQIAHEYIFNDGQFQSGMEWYKNGQICADDTHTYKENGDIIKKRGFWVYRDGSKKYGYSIEEGYCSFSPTGELAIKTIISEDKSTTDFKNTIIYYDNILRDCYQLLLVNLYPKHDSLFYNEEHKIWGWVAKTYLNDMQRALEILNNPKVHGNGNVANTAKSWLKKIESNNFSAEAFVNNIGYQIIIE